MRMHPWRCSLSFVLMAAAIALSGRQAQAQFGLIESGVGPINRSMGGASTAAPIDSAGALYWNPATITALPKTEMEFGMGFLIPRTTLRSFLPAGSIGPFAPPRTLSGNTGGNNGVFPLPTFGLVYQPDDSPWTFGVGAFTTGGFGVNYPASSLRSLHANPILTPQAPFGFGVGPLFAQYQVFQFAPTAALQVTDEFSVGLQANIDMATLSADPALFASPTLVRTPNPFIPFAPNYPAATHGRFRGGGGFQAGVFYNPEASDWAFGASFKSPQWFETYTYNAINANGQVVNPKFNLDNPWIASIGTSYSGINRLLIATDVRYLDYRDTNGFRHAGFDPRTLALRGLGWQSVFALATGVQYRVTDSLALRAGYTFALNPVGNSLTSFNVAAPTIIQHSVAAGFSYDVTQYLKLSLAYAHDFQSSITGPFIVPGRGPIQGSSIRSASTADSVQVGATLLY